MYGHTYIGHTKLINSSNIPLYTKCISKYWHSIVQIKGQGRKANPSTLPRGRYCALSSTLPGEGTGLKPSAVALNWPSQWAIPSSYFKEGTPA